MRSQLRQLGRQVGEAEREAGVPDGRDADRAAYERFDWLGWILIHPDGEDDDPALRVRLWPWFALKGVSVTAASADPFPGYWADVRPLADATHSWVLCEGWEHRWWPMNPATLHWLKLTWRAHGLSSYGPIVRGQSNGTFPNGSPRPFHRPSGAAEAESLDEFFPGTARPWDRGFDADPATWPERLRDAVRRSHSLWPEWPDPPGAFDWSGIPRSWEGGAPFGEWPYPRDDDGRPVPGWLDDQDDDSAVAT